MSLLGRLVQEFTNDLFQDRDAIPSPVMDAPCRRHIWDVVTKKGRYSKSFRKSLEEKVAGRAKLGYGLGVRFLLGNDKLLVNTPDFAYVVTTGGKVEKLWLFRDWFPELPKRHVYVDAACDDGDSIILSYKHRGRKSFWVSLKTGTPLSIEPGEQAVCGPVQVASLLNKRTEKLRRIVQVDRTGKVVNRGPAFPGDANDFSLMLGPVKIAN